MLKISNIIFLLLLLGIVGCGSANKINRSEQYGNTDNTYFLIKDVNGSLNINNEINSFTGNIRYCPDSVIQMSYAPARIELARLQILNDSIKFVDRYNKRYFNKPVRNVIEYYHIPLNFNLVESVISLNEFIYDGLGQKYKTINKLNTKIYKRNFKSDSVFQEIGYFENSQLVKQIRIIDSVNEYEIVIDNKDFTQLGSYYFCTQTTIEFKKKDNSGTLHIKFNDIRQLNNLSFNIKAPENYNEMFF